MVFEFLRAHNVPSPFLRILGCMQEILHPNKNCTLNYPGKCRILDPNRAGFHLSAQGPVCVWGIRVRSAMLHGQLSS